MKKFIFVVLSLFMATSLMAQINFETGNWAEVKAKAKKEKKMIFIDAYTSWCGPCKMMVKDVFPLPEVGDFYNKNFICYKIDAEKGEGVAIAKKFEIRSYPTYLYMDCNEKLFYRSGSSMSAKRFIDEGKMAVSLFADKKGIEQWDKEYLKKKNDPKFMKEYLVKRTQLRLDNADLFDQYVTICNGNETFLFDKDFLGAIYGNSGTMNAGGICFNFIMDNLDKVTSVLAVERDRFLYNLPFMTTLYTIKKAAEKGDENLFQQTIEGNKRLMEATKAETKDTEYHLLCYYFNKTKQATKLDEVADRYAETLLSQLPKYEENDKKIFAEYIKPLSKNNDQFKGKTTDEIVMTLSYMMNSSSSSLSFKFRDLALWVSMLTEKAELKTKSIEWALLSYKLFDNFSNTEAVAEAYFQAGRYKEAQFWIDLTVKKIPEMATDDIRDRVKERVERFNKATL